jgi:HEPN domain-containing protein
MTPPDEVKRTLTRHWIEKADDDLAAAAVLIAAREHWNHVCYLAQQSVEKALKALLTHHQVEFPKTHDLGDLLDLIATRDPARAKSLADVMILTRYAIELRYPGPGPDACEADAQEALTLAHHCMTSVKAALSLQ